MTTAAIIHLPLARLIRVPRAWFPIAGWAVLGLVAAFVERAGGSSHAADHVLIGSYAQVVLPLLVLAIVSGALGSEGLGASVRSLSRFGASERRVALVLMGTSMVVSAAISALLAVVLVLITGSAGGVAVDAITSAWVCGLGGAAYAAWFSLGASFGKHGGGRAAFFIIDWVLGSGTGVGAVLTPRGNLRNLLGGAAPGELSQQASTLALLVLVVLFTLIAARRVRR
ncbi:MAG: hypothetical protein ABIP39_13855 [Polyangiaceae bacterium]